MELFHIQIIFIYLCENVLWLGDEHPHLTPTQFYCLLITLRIIFKLMLI